MQTFCERFQQELLDKAGREVTEHEREHLRSCPGCREMYEVISTVGIELLRTAREAEGAMPSRLRPELKKQVLGRMRARLADNPVTSASRPPSRRSWSVLAVLQSALPAGKARWYLGWAAAGAAVVVLVVIGLSLPARQRSIGTLEFADGVVQVEETAGTFAFEKIGEMKLTRAARIQVPRESKGLLSLGRGVRCAVAGATELALTSGNRVDLLAGRTWFRILPGGIGFEVRSPHGTIGVTGTCFGVAVDGDGTHVEVTEGTVWVRRADEQIVLSAGQETRITDNAMTVPVPRAEGTALPEWVRSLLAKEKAAHAGQYIPSVAIE